METEERRVIDARVDEQVETIREQCADEGDEAGYEAGLKKGHDEAFAEFQEESAEIV